MLQDVLVVGYLVDLDHCSEQHKPGEQGRAGHDQVALRHEVLAVLAVHGQVHLLVDDAQVLDVRLG